MKKMHIPNLSPKIKELLEGKYNTRTYALLCLEMIAKAKENDDGKFKWI